MRKNLKMYFIAPVICILMLWGYSSRAQAETIISEDITSDTTWQRASSPYILDGSRTVAENTTLTIEPGVTVKMRAQADDKGVFGVTGRLNAVGTATDPIIFTSEADSEVGEWSGILFMQQGTERASGQLEHVIVRNGGRSMANIKLYMGADVVILDSEISHSKSNGIEVQLNSSLDIRDTVISHNEIGLSVSQSELIYQRNIVQNNRSYPLELDADDVSAIEDSTFENNLISRIHIQRTSGSLNVDTTWSTHTGLTDYEFASSLTIEKDVTMTVTPGVEILMNSSSLAGIYVEGTLVAKGTEDAPIIFTSSSDTGAGEWEGIAFRGGTARQGSGIFDHVKIRNGGSSWANVRLSEGADVQINNSVIMDSAKNGLEVNDSTLKLDCALIGGNRKHGILHNSGKSSGTGLTFERNGEDAIHNLSADGVDFRYNWWDVAPDILEHITGAVLYKPWLDEPGCQLYDLELSSNVSSKSKMFMGTPFVYEYYVSNFSPDQLTMQNVILIHEFAPGQSADSEGLNNVTVTSMKTSKGICNQVENTVHCALGNLIAGEPIAVSVIVEPENVGTIASRTIVESAEPDVYLDNSIIDVEINIEQGEVVQGETEQEIEQDEIEQDEIVQEEIEQEEIVQGEEFDETSLPSYLLYLPLIVE